MIFYKKLLLFIVLFLILFYVLNKNIIRTVTLIDNTQFKVNIPYFTHWSKFWWNAIESDGWESETFRIFKNIINNESIILDLGAWIGPITLYAASLGAKKVYSFEPDPIAYNLLLDNININNNIKNNIIAINKCISNITSKIILYSDYGHSTSTLYKKNGNLINIECITLYDWWLQVKLKYITLIKIDVEGTEDNIISELPFLLSKLNNIPILWLSLHTEYINSTKIINKLLYIYKYCWWNGNIFLPIIKNNNCTTNTCLVLCSNNYI